MPPQTTKRTTTNSKTKNNQNCQKIKLYGSPTTKELKKKHSFGLVRGAEMGSQGREDAQQSSGWGPGRAEAGRPGGPTLCADKPGGTTGEQGRLHNSGFQCRKRKPQNL